MTRNQPTGRMCVVTRRVKPLSDLVRFVVDPDGALVPDLKHRLPGRGVWVTAEAAHIRTAARDRLFERALKTPLRVADDLAAQTGDLLKQALVGALSLARKGGGLVTGFDMVERAIDDGRVVALVHALEAGEHGTAKLQAAVKRRFGPDAQIPVLRRLTEPELSLALGKSNVIHAALLAGRASRHALDQIEQLARFHGEPHGDTEPTLRTADRSAEHSHT